MGYEIDDLKNERYFLREGPIPVEVVKLEVGYQASFPNRQMAVSGESEEKALDSLRLLALDQYDFLSGIETSNLHPHLQRRKTTLEQSIGLVA